MKNEEFSPNEAVIGPYHVFAAGRRAIQSAKLEKLALAPLSGANHEAAFEADAKRLAMELECVMLGCKDTAVSAKWWDSGMEALEQHQKLLEDRSRTTLHQWDKAGERCAVCGDKDWMGGDCRNNSEPDDLVDCLRDMEQAFHDAGDSEKSFALVQAIIRLEGKSSSTIDAVSRAITEGYQDMNRPDDGDVDDWRMKFWKLGRDLNKLEEHAVDPDPLKEFRVLNGRLRLKTERLAELLEKADKNIVDVVEKGESINEIKMSWALWATIRAHLIGLIEQKCEADAELAKVMVS